MALLDIVCNVGDPATNLEQSRGNIGSVADINTPDYTISEVPTNITPMFIKAE